MYIAACDDQIEELEKLTALLQAWQSDRRSDVRFQTFRSGGQLLDAARAERFTLYLLDVLMPGMTGMDAAREIRSFDAAADIIFLTTSPGFAYESYGVRAAEYLLKPINAKLLYPVLDKLYLRDQKPQDGLTVKSNGMLVRLPFSQLSYTPIYLRQGRAPSKLNNVRYSSKHPTSDLRTLQKTICFLSSP